MDQDLAQGDVTEVLKHKPKQKQWQRPLRIKSKTLFWLSKRSYREVSLTCNTDKK